MPNYQYAPSRKENREFWTRQVQAYHLSGLSQKEFCIQNDLIYSSFGYWKRRLENGAAQNGIEFVEIDPSLIAAAPVVVTLSTDHFDVKIHEGADPEMIAHILKELRS